MRQHLHPIKYLCFEYKLNNGKEKTFWFNLILLKKINKTLIFELLNEHYLIIIIDYAKNIIFIEFDKDSIIFKMLLFLIFNKFIFNFPFFLNFNISFVE
jgi:hypothetical protein